MFPRPSPRAGGWGRGGPCSAARGARGACRPAPLASAGSGVPQAGRLGSAGVDAAQVGSINVFVAVEAAEWLTRDEAPARGPGSGRGPQCVARRMPRECRGRGVEPRCGRGCGAVEVSRGAPRGRASQPVRPSRAWGTGWPAAWTARERLGPRRKWGDAGACVSSRPSPRDLRCLVETRESGVGQLPSLSLLKEKRS